MKILCVADEIDPLVYSSSARKRYEDVDIVLSAGDLPFRYYDYIMTYINKDVCYVYGNHNLEFFREKMYNEKDFYSNKDIFYNFNGVYAGNLVDGKCYYDKKNDLIVAGLGGCMLYNNGLSQYSEKEMKWRITKLLPRLLYNKTRYGRYLDILLTHAPVEDFGDGKDICHRGFNSFKAFIEIYKPKYLIHGHVHLFDENQNRVYKYKETTIINAYKSIVLNYNEGTIDG